MKDILDKCGFGKRSFGSSSEKMNKVNKNVHNAQDRVPGHISCFTSVCTYAPAIRKNIFHNLHSD